MFLKKIELKGFKSFANSTTVNFQEGLTVIVGPNGSGKSNINDALKWVLGESSRKTLRATTSKDVIFNGSETLGPSDYAEVSLYFDNKSRILDYDTDTVIVTRKAFREKDQNQYFLNKELVRRKDIKNLFLDTGLGNTNLSIISQGAVSRITESKPDELKELLNEAAGVSKYQKQKNESLQKLEIVGNNLNVFKIKLKVLEKQIKPLENASEKAEKYNKLKKELLEIELPLINIILKNALEKKEELEKRLTDSDIKKKSFNKYLEQTTEEIKELQIKINYLEKQIDSFQIKERELERNSVSFKSSSDDLKVIEERIKQYAKSISDLKKIVSKSSEEEEKLNLEISKLRSEQFELTVRSEKENSSINKINLELEQIRSKEKSYSRGTSAIIENKNIFNKIFGTVRDLIKYEDKYEIAINSAIGSKLKNVVVNNEQTIKAAVRFLKENKYGNATFIPSEKVRAKFISKQYLNPLARVTGYLGVLEDFIQTDEKFKNTIASLAGNIILCDNLNNALNAANFLEHKFQFVTLDGDIIYPGFTVKGGYNSSLSNKEYKEKLLKAKEIINKKIDNSANNLDEISNKIRDLSSKRNNIQNEEIRISERITYVETQFQQNLLTYKNITGREFDFNLIEDFIQKNQSENLSLEHISNKLRNLKYEKQNVLNKLISLQEEQSKYNQDWAKLTEKITDDRLLLNDLNSTIEYNNEILNSDYKLNYQLLSNKKIKPPKDMQDNLSYYKSKRQDIREQIKELGYIDVDAIEKYNQLKEEYDSLKKDVDELSETKEKLLSIIEIADKEMISRLTNSFNDVNIRFNTIFQMLFRGGNASIILTKPDDILESGIEIAASAPGKTIKTLSLYSGGEKSLITLSLIFAINEVRKLPLLLLDEVEAALDEANVERFANFAKILNETTQLIIVTHRPGTMEKADYLYGVTMQQRGITDIFNVKLQEAIQIAE